MHHTSLTTPCGRWAPRLEVYRVRCVDPRCPTEGGSFWYNEALVCEFFASRTWTLDRAPWNGFAKACAATRRLRQKSTGAFLLQLSVAVRR